MDIRYDPHVQCIGCGQAIPLERQEQDVFEGQCRECKALYRLRVATYKQSTQ